MVRNYQGPQTRNRAGNGAMMLCAILLSAEGSNLTAQSPANDGLRAPTTPLARTVSPANWPRLHIPDPVGHHAARQALDLAWERLEQPDCAGVLSAFTDHSGHSLDENVRTVAVDSQTYLTMVVFIDGSRETPCVTGV